MIKELISDIDGTLWAMSCSMNSDIHTRLSTTTAGITHWRSIASHHVPGVMHRKDFTPVSGPIRLCYFGLFLRRLSGVREL